MLGFYLGQFLTGLATASSLFLVASGLSIIFGVTRIVNFAHGSFYMLGAFLAVTLVEIAPWGPVGFWASVLLAAVTVGLIGVLSRCWCCAASTTRPSCSSWSPPSASCW
jgi:branched-chain amino acid transport system permease protein